MKLRGILVRALAVALLCALAPALAIVAMVETNTNNAKTGAYAAVSGDCGKTITLGGSAFYTLTVGAASGFPATCVIDIANVDPLPASGGRGKTMAINGITFPLQSLYPSMSFTIKKENNAWVMFGLPNRWKTPAGALITLNTDFVNGNDDNDGLAIGAGNALKTVEAALGIAASSFDLTSTNNPTHVLILMAADDSQGVHQSFHGFVGANGGAAIMIDGGGHSFTAPVQFYYGVVIQIRNVTFSNPRGPCLAPQWKSTVYVMDLVTFGTCTEGHIIVGTGASRLEFENDYTVSGSASFHIVADTSASVSTGVAITVTISNPLTMTNWVSNTFAYLNLSAVTYNLAGHTVTGGKGQVLFNGAYLQSQSTLAVTGAVSGTGGVCRLTVPTTTLAENQRVITASIGGATGCNIGSSTTGVLAHIVDATHLELTGTTLGGVYTSGGTVQIGAPGTTDPSVSFGGQIL